MEMKIMVFNLLLEAMIPFKKLKIILMNTLILHVLNFQWWKFLVVQQIKEVCMLHMLILQMDLKENDYVMIHYIGIITF